MSTFLKKNYPCNTHTHTHYTLICETRAWELYIPDGMHFLLGGKSSSLPNRFQRPSSSRGVKWTLSVCSSCSSSSSSLDSSSSVIPFSMAKMDGFFRPNTDNDDTSHSKKNLHRWTVGLFSYRCPKSVSETLVWGKKSWSGWTHIAPTHTSTFHNRRGNGT